MKEKFLLSALALVIAVGALGVPAPGASPPAPAQTAAGPRVLILPPKLTVEQLQDDRPLPADQHSGPLIVSYLSSSAVKELGARNYSPVTSDDASAAAIAGPCRTLSEASSKLIRGIPSDELREALGAIEASGRYDAVFAQLAQMKIGPPGYWNPQSGAIGSNMSSLALRAALIDCGTGEIRWKGQAMQRGEPAPEEKDLRKLVTQLYAELREGK